MDQIKQQGVLQSNTGDKNTILLQPTLTPLRKKKDSSQQRNLNKVSRVILILTYFTPKPWYCSFMLVVNPFNKCHFLFCLSSQCTPTPLVPHQHHTPPSLSSFSLYNDVMVFDPGRELGEGRRREKGIVTSAGPEAGSKRGGKKGWKSKGGRRGWGAGSVYGKPDLVFFLSAMLILDLSLWQWQSGEFLCVSECMYYILYYTCTFIQSCHHSVPLCLFVSYEPNPTLFLSR